MSDSERTETQTPADKIWLEIKDKQVDMFSLPPQKVEAVVKRDFVDPSKLYLVLNASAALPAIETSIGPKYKLELVGKWVTVSRA